MFSETQASRRGRYLGGLMIMLCKVALFAVAVVLTSSCWVSTIPSYYHDFGPSCYPHSSLKNNLYGQIIREHFSFYPHSSNMIPREGLRTAAALVDLGVPVNEPVENGSTPLMWSTWAGFQNLVELFLDAGADVNAQAKGGATAIFCSTSGAFSGQRTTELLLDAGAEVDTAVQNGTTPLMIAVRRLNLAVVEVLLKRGAEPNLQDDDGMTALMFAATAQAYGFEKYTVELLLEAGADVHLRNREGKTALMIAQENENDELVHLLENVSGNREGEH